MSCGRATRCPREQKEKFNGIIGGAGIFFSRYIEVMKKRTFWNKIRFILDKTSCWEFQGYRYKDGYGSQSIRRNGKKTGTGAHRWMYVLVHQYPELIDDPKTLACHTCDNPPCCRPSHIFLGNNTANMRDMAAKGRSVMTRICKITDKQVNEIRALTKCAIRMDAQIARMYGLESSETIRLIRLNRTHKVVPVVILPEQEILQLQARLNAFAPPNHRLKLTDDQATEILYLSSISSRTDGILARRYGVNQETVRNIRIGKYYSHLSATTA